MMDSEWQQFGLLYFDSLNVLEKSTLRLRREFVARLNQRFQENDFRIATEMGHLLFTPDEIRSFGRNVTKKFNCPLVDYLSLQLPRGLPIIDLKSRNSKQLKEGELRKNMEVIQAYPFIVEYEIDTKSGAEAFVKKIIEFNQIQNCSFENPCANCKTCKDLHSILTIKMGALREKRSINFTKFVVRIQYIDMLFIYFSETYLYTRILRVSGDPRSPERFCPLFPRNPCEFIYRNKFDTTPIH